jgi:hypothetical protein
MGRHDWATTPACSTSDEQGRDVCTLPLSSAGLQRRRVAQPQGSLLICFYLSSFPLSLSCTPGPSLVYKRKGWVPHLVKISNTQKHFKHTSNTLHLHQRLGISSLSRSFVTPATSFRAGNMSSLELDVGTFNPNQYNSLCLPSSSSGPNTQHKFTSRRFETPTSCHRCLFPLLTHSPLSVVEPNIRPGGRST